MKSSDILSPTAHDLVETRTCNSSSKNYRLGNCPECLKLEQSLSDFKVDVELISFSQLQRVEKKIVKVNQTIPFGQVIPKWVETISNLKDIIQKTWASCQLWNLKRIFWPANLQYFYFLFILPWSQTRRFGEDPYRSD